ncbi:unnamed protein product, partial [Mesorhabditis spiculigera]
MYGQGPSSSRERGVNISFEPLSDWQISEIGYDGAEKFIRPESFQDHVGKLARKVDWRKLVDSEDVYDQANLLPTVEPLEGEEDEEKRKREQAEYPPEAGPWHVVAKNLHESLQQLNIMIDTFQVAQKFEYLQPLSVQDPTAAHDLAPHVLESTKGFQWVWRRKALSEAQAVIESAMRTRPTSSFLENTDDSTKQKRMFYGELDRLRKVWRIRKSGTYILGDLGYSSFGKKWDAKNMFDINRRTICMARKYPDGRLVQSWLQVTVPYDVAKRSTLSVSIVKDDKTNSALFGAGGDNELDYMKVQKKTIENTHWHDALTWASESLVLRDTFQQLAKDAVRLKYRPSAIRDGVLLISLFDEYLLRVELKYFPFKEGRLPEDGNSYLNRSLRKIFLAMVTQRSIRPQMFVELPLTNAPEEMDMRGSSAMTQTEMDARSVSKPMLLERILKVAAHHHLVQLTVDMLKQHQIECRDPQLKWRWLRCAPANSHIICHLANHQFDYLMGKVTFYIKIDHNAVTLSTKESQEIECYRDGNRILNALRYMNSQYFMGAITSLAKVAWAFQILHANMNAIDGEGNPAPTLYMVNPISSRSLLVQFNSNRDPDINVKKLLPEEDAEEPFVRLDYKKLPGGTLCRKLDYLFAVLHGPIHRLPAEATTPLRLKNCVQDWAVLESGTSPLARENQPRKPLIDHELEAELTDVKWVAVYRYLPIRLAAMVARMKLVQTIASVLYVPYSIFNYIQGTIDWSWLVNTTSLAVFAPLALVLFSRTMNRLVGVIAVDETNSYARIGYVSFWGRRMNKVRPIEDVVPLTNSEGDTTQKVVKLSFLSDSSYVLLPTRPVEIVDPERAHLLFGDLKFFDVENPKEQQSQ